MIKGYFSRLIQQTGITFGPDGDFKPNPIEASPVISKESDRTTPIHMEESKLIEPQTDQKMHGDAKEDSVSDIPVTEAGHIQHLTEEKVESGILEEPKSSTLELEKPNQQMLKPKEQKSTVLDRDIHISAESVQVQNKTGEGKLLEGVETDENDTVTKEYIQNPDKSSESVNQGFTNDPAFKPEENSDDGYSREQIWHSSLKEVRGWVAEAPDVSIKEIPSKDISKTVSAEKGAPVSLSKTESPVSFYKRPTESQPIEEPKIHDFHLSVGTISLTIEEPQKEIKRSEQPLMKKERTHKRDVDSTRLSRHYIRIR